jgi:hypothetical protein
MKEETINALDTFIRYVVVAISDALPNKQGAVKDVVDAASALRNALSEEEIDS